MRLLPFLLDKILTEKKNAIGILRGCYATIGGVESKFNYYLGKFLFPVSHNSHDLWIHHFAEVKGCHGTENYKLLEQVG